MKNLTMTKTAVILDRILQVLYVATKVGIIALLIGLGFLAAYFLFDLELWMIGTGFNEVDLGSLALTITEDALPDPDKIVLVLACLLAVALVALVLCRKLVACFRGILAPMKEGAPFRNEVSQNLKTAAKYVFAMGIVGNVGILVQDIIFTLVYGLPELLIGDAITHVTVRYQMELNFLISVAVLLLLSYVFRYGESLQQLSDETL